MKKSIILFLLFQVQHQLVFAQDSEEAGDKDTTAIFDFLKPSSAPAFILLGTQPNDIETPSSPTDIMVSFANATDNFSRIPSSFAIDVNPFWAFAKKSTGYDSRKFKYGRSAWYNFKQTVRISAGANTLDTTYERKQKLTQTALGFKFSILRGHLDKKSTRLIDSLHAFDAIRNFFEIKAQRKVVKELGVSVDSPDYLLKVKEVLAHLLDSTKIDSIETSFKKYTVTPNQFQRKGFKLDLSGGVVYDFPDQKWENRGFSKGAVWTTFGWELESSGKFIPSILGIGRFQIEKNHGEKEENSPDNLSYLDGGARFLLAHSNGKVNLSAEYVFRKKLQDENPLKDGNRFVFNFDYLLDKNQSVTLTIGKNFDNQYYRTGNLMAALNYAIGLGNKRNLVLSEKNNPRP